MLQWHLLYRHAARHRLHGQPEQGRVAGRGQGVAGQEEGSSSSSLDHPGLAAPRRQRAAGARPTAAPAPDLLKNRFTLLPLRMPHYNHFLLS